MIFKLILKVVNYQLPFSILCDLGRFIVSFQACSMSFILLPRSGVATTPSGMPLDDARLLGCIGRELSIDPVSSTEVSSSEKDSPPLTEFSDTGSSASPSDSSSASSSVGPVQFL